jgi:hypothetical protein
MIVHSSAWGSSHARAARRALHSDVAAQMRPQAIVLAASLLGASTFAASPARAACTEIENYAQLQAMQADLAGSYCLAKDIDGAGKPSFVPVGSGAGLFTGTFDGRDHTISNLSIDSAVNYVGLFGLTDGAIIENLRLVNARVRATGDNASAGAVVGLVDGNGGAGVIRGVEVSGRIECTASNCFPGGIVGSTNGPGKILQSSSSARVIGTTYAGGAAAFMFHATISRTHATGAVTCSANNCMAGGLVARASLDAVFDQCFATGPVASAGGTDGRAGGLIAYTESGTKISRCYAEGSVRIGATGFAAGLVGQHNSGGPIDQVYSVGPVSSTGGQTGGLIYNSGGNPTITAAYWDTETSGQATSNGGGAGMTTAQLQTALPPGFGGAWSITPGLSYPFLVNVTFLSPLATLVDTSKVLVFAPLGQFDDGNYGKPPEHPDGAALAAVYTIIARGVGSGLKVPKLSGVAIDKYFWDDEAEKTRFKGPLTDYVTLGKLTKIPAGERLSDGNVVGAFALGKLVILRGKFKREGGGTGTHWMLGTLHTEKSIGKVTAVLADDPWTGRQVSVDPKTKRVTTPGFPLEDFEVDAFQEVTLN